jgi:hypothetical protein
MKRNRSKVSIQDLVKNGLLEPGEELRFFGGDGAQAEVTPQGTVLFNGVEHRSLSSAAHAIRGTSLNGWTAWRVRTGHQGWIAIAELRHQLEQRLEASLRGRH